MMFLVFASVFCTVYFLQLIPQTPLEVGLNALLGLFGTPIIQFIKRVTGSDGTKAFLWTIAVSAILGTAVTFLFNGWDGTNVVSSISIVFSLATIAYRFFVSNDAIIGSSSTTTTK